MAFRKNGNWPIYIVRLVVQSGFFLAFCLLMSSCAVGPNYSEPEIALPDAWANAAAEDVRGDAPHIEKWWTAFGDTLLNNLIAEVKTANPDAAAAVARMDEARAYHQIAGGGLWPQIQATGSVARVDLAENGLSGAAIAAGAENPTTNFDAGLGASWEIDVWGKTRRTREATGARVQSSIEDYRDVMVSLYAEVATTYVNYRSLQERLKFARQNVYSQRESMDIVIAREDAGLVPLLDVAQARSNLAQTEASIPFLETEIEYAQNQLAILLGQLPGALDARLAAPGALPMPSTDVLVALPVELLRRRPDVRRSERNLASQTARVGVASAELYPSFSLAGALTLQSGDLGTLTDGDSFGWSLVPGVKWNLFTGGKIRGQIKVEEAKTQQLLAAYEKTVLGALAEVENTLVSLKQEEIRMGLMKTAAESAQQSVLLVHEQYISGLTNFTSYLDAQRVQFQQQDQLAVSRGQLVVNLINLNRALGGGWSLDEDIPTGVNNDQDIAGKTEEVGQ